MTFIFNFIDDNINIKEKKKLSADSTPKFLLVGFTIDKKIHSDHYSIQKAIFKEKENKKRGLDIDFNALILKLVKTQIIRKRESSVGKQLFPIELPILPSRANTRDRPKGN